MAEIITLTPTQTQGGISWTLCHANKCGGPGANPASAYPAIEIPKYTKDALLIFKINDPTNTISFANNSADPYSASDAIWVVPGSGKHPSNPGIDSRDQLENVTLADGKTLVLNDKNNTPWPLALSYRLNFEGPNGQAVTAIDPDIKNGGGGGGSTNYLADASNALIIGVAVALVLVGAVVGRLIWR